MKVFIDVFILLPPLARIISFVDNFLAPSKETICT